MLNVDVAKVNKQAARCACEWVVRIPERVATHVTRVAHGVLHARAVLVLCEMLVSWTLPIAARAHRSLVNLFLACIYPHGPEFTRTVTIGVWAFCTAKKRCS